MHEQLGSCSNPDHYTEQSKFCVITTCFYVMQKITKRLNETHQSQCTGVLPAGDGAGAGLPVLTATTGLRTTCFSDTQLRLPSAVSSCSAMPWLLTDTVKVFFSPVFVKDSVSGETWIASVAGASTLAV
jgi:hypothetical protein